MPARCAWNFLVWWSPRAAAGGSRLLIPFAIGSQAARWPMFLPGGGQTGTAFNRLFPHGGRRSSWCSAGKAGVQRSPIEARRAELVALLAISEHHHRTERSPWKFGSSQDAGGRLAPWLSKADRPRRALLVGRVPLPGKVIGAGRRLDLQAAHELLERPFDLHCPGPASRPSLSPVSARKRPCHSCGPQRLESAPALAS